MGGLDKINIKLPQQFATSLVEQKDHDTTPRKKTTSTTLTNQQVSLSPSSNTTGSNAYTEDTSYHQLSNNQEDFQNFNSNFAIIYEQESKDETDIKVSKKKKDNGWRKRLRSPHKAHKKVNTEDSNLSFSENKNDEIEIPLDTKSKTKSDTNGKEYLDLRNND